MALAPRLSRLSAAALAVLGLAGALACGGKKSSSPAVSTVRTLSGTVRYTRIPLSKDVNGVPTGLETDATKFDTQAPARGLAVRIYQRGEVGAVVGWVMVSQVITDGNGAFSTNLPMDQNYSVELVSEGFDSGGVVNLIADPNGLSSTLPQAQRPRYLLRKGVDGAAATPASGGTPANVTPYAKLDSDKVVNFTVDTSTSWLTGRVDLDSATLTSTVFPLAAFESSPTGSRPLAILDTLYHFAANYGDPTPSRTLDLHYFMGRSEPEGTFIEYNRDRWIQPDGSDLAYDADLNLRHYFGSVSGGANDDAMDEALIYQMAGKAAIFNRLVNFPMTGGQDQRLMPPPSPMDNLSPEMALMEGMPAAMAANLLKSPYLADTMGAVLATPTATDIRDISGVAPSDKGPLSPRTIAAAAWAMILKANSLPDPGQSTDWDKINPSAFSRFFTIQSPLTSTTVGTVTTTLVQPPNIFNQIKLLQSTPSGVVNLQAIFTDATLSALLTPPSSFNIPWPQPSTGAFSTFVTNWGPDPIGTKGPLTLSMAQAQSAGGVFPNLSVGEVQYAVFTLDAAVAYDLSVTTTPSTLPSGAQVEVAFLAAAPNQFSLVSAGSSGPTRISLAGGTLASPLNQYLRIRLLSPSTQIPDVQVSLTFTKVLTPKKP